MLRVYRNSENPLGAIEFYNNEVKARKILPDLRYIITLRYNNAQCPNVVFYF